LHDVTSSHGRPEFQFMLMLLSEDDYADNVSIFIRGKRMTLKSEKGKSCSIQHVWMV